MAGFILLMRFLSKSYSVKLNDKLTVGVGCRITSSGKLVSNPGIIFTGGIAIRGCAQVAFTPLTCSDTIYVMLVTETFFQTFTKKEIVDAHKAVEFSITLSADSIDAVNEMVDKAEAAGATMPNPANNYGFMYQRSFDDLDGHHWEFMWMDPNGIPAHQG